MTLRDGQLNEASHLSVDTRISRNNELLGANMDDEVILLHPDTSTYFCLNASSAEIWQCLEEDRQVSEICLDLQRKFDVDETTCRRDVLQHVEELLKKDLVRTAGTAA